MYNMDNGRFIHIDRKDIVIPCCDVYGNILMGMDIHLAIGQKM